MEYNQRELLDRIAPDKTSFDETVVAFRTSDFNIKPTWGVSVLRDTTTVSGTGAAIAETGGELRLQSGTTANGSAKIVTNNRGQYEPGSTILTGVGIRIPTDPTGTQDIKWGYYDADNGVGYGMDATGVYVFLRTGGDTTKVYQTDWNVDKLDGTGKSGVDLTVSNGIIYQVEMVWYGYGTIRYYVTTRSRDTAASKKVEVHRINTDAAVSIVDPNLPITVEVGNGASSDTDLSVYVGGRQYSVLEGQSRPFYRPVVQNLSNYTLATNTNWQPLIAYRRKATHGPSNRNNSVNVRHVGFDIVADNALEVMVTVDGTTSNLSWTTPTNWTDGESAVEVKVTGGTALTTSSTGHPVQFSSVAANRNTLQRLNQEELVNLGDATEVILWVRRYSASGAIVVNTAVLKWEELW